MVASTIYKEQRKTAMQWDFEYVCEVCQPPAMPKEQHIAQDWPPALEK